jgi:hypothetical protein
MVRIFPKSADQAKSTTLMQTLFRQIHFQGKGMGTSTILNDLTLNNHLFEGTQQTCLHLPAHSSAVQQIILKLLRDSKKEIK